MIALSMVRHRLRSVLGGFVALVLGVALIAASGIVIASSLPDVPPRYGQADVLAVPEAAGTRSDDVTTARGVWGHGEADALAEEIAGSGGVETAVAERRFDVRVMDGERTLGEPVGDTADGAGGAGWSSFGLGSVRMLEGGAPTGTDQVVLPASYDRSVGDTVTVLTAGAEWPMTVSGVTDGDDVLVPDRLAEGTATAVSVIGVVASPGIDPADAGDRVRGVLGPSADVFTGADRGAMAAEFDDADNWVGQQLLVLVGLLAVFVSVFVVGTTFTFQVEVRRRELALLRAVGATPRQVRRMLLGEAAVVGTAASLVGAVAGIAGAFLLGRWMVGMELLSPGWEVRTVALPVGVAVVTGVAAAVAGVLGASRRAARVAPLEALRPVEARGGTVPRWRLWTGIAAAALGGVLVVATARGDMEASISFALCTSLALVVSAAVAAPVFLPRVVGLVPGRSALAELLRAETRADPRRAAATMLPALLVAALAVTVLGQTDTLGAAIDEHSRGEVPGEAMVVQEDGNLGLTDRALERTREHAEGEVASQLSTGVYVDGRWVEAVGRHLDSPPEGTVWASPATAAEFGWEEGDTVDLTWRDGSDGRVPVTVAPFPPELELWAELALPHDLAREHDPGTFAISAAFDPRDAGALSAELADQGSRVVATDRLFDDGVAEELRLLRLFTGIILALSLGYTAVSLANTLSLSTSARRRDLALLRVTGAHRRQVLGLLTAETGLVTAVGLALGALLSLPGLFALTVGLRDEFDPREGPAEVAVHLPWAELGAVGAASLTIALAAALVPAVRALRRPPVA
ncbi:FtsX-like permease family protein [Nocardiopsis sp. HNM0947]|uniref:FtsX-like permease family protein n=1 Tax=Nocardiopsis coralli TaxID=2772213 RepID=A0ABR9P3A8_9ACTN|nr:FtsX-like permease family protein [Nocardiopsis coralli]MBE2998341.1 FtsX-like permease family protein [Nocardiopsis coralli]